MSRRILGTVALAISLLALAGCSTVRTRILMNEGNKLYKAQKYEDAIAEYKKILSIDSNDWAANYQVAMSWLALYHPGSEHSKDREAAENAVLGFEKLMTLKAPDKETEEKVHTYYVAILRSANMTDKAIAYYVDLLQKNPKDLALLSQLAEIYAKRGDFDKALEYYQKRAAADPENKEAWYTIGVVCWERASKFGPTLSTEERTSTIETGIKAQEKAIALDPNYFDALVYMGLIYRQKQLALSAEMKNEEAGEAFTTAEEFKKRAEAIAKERMAAAAAKKTS